MTPKDDLYRLVQAMTPHERQVFSKVSKGAKKAAPKYLKLFKELCDLEEYDEKNFLDSRRGVPFANGYSVQKRELIGKILHVLRSQRQSSGAEKPLEFQVRERMEEARLLREKKLFDLSFEHLLSARAEAEKYQFHEILLEILRFQRSLILDNQSTGYGDAIRLLHDEIAELGLVIQNKYHLLDLRDQLFIPARQHAPLANRLDMTEISYVMQNAELQDVGLCLSFDAECNYHFCHAMYHHLQDNALQAWIHFRTIYLRWQEQRAIQRARPLDYRNMLQNYLSFCNDALHLEDFDETLLQLGNGPFHSEEEEIAAKQNSLYVRLQQHLNFCEWNLAHGVFEEFKKSLPETGERINPSRMMTYYLSFSRMFLVLGKWNESAKWAHLVIEEGKGHKNEGLVAQAQLQELMAMMEADKSSEKEMKRFEKACNRVLETLARRQGVEFELQLVQCLAEGVLMKEYPSRKKRATEVLETLTRQSDRRRSTDEFIKAWLVSKRDSKGLAEVLATDRDEKLKINREAFLE